MPRLMRWLERTHHLDRLELELEWGRITPADIFDELAEIVAGQDRAALDCLRSEIEQPRLRRLFEFFYRQMGGPSPVETLRLLDAARGMVAAADALLEEMQGEAEPAALASAEASSLWAGAGWWKSALRARLSGEATGEPGSANIEPRTIRLPEFRAEAAGAEAAGTLGTLSVLRLSGGSGRLFEHPLLQSLTPLTRDFAAAVTLAWTEALALLPAEEQNDALAHDYIWWTQSGGERGGAVLAGGSHGAALTTLLALALQDRPADPEFTLTGTVLPGGAIGGVAGVRDKARAALGLRGTFGTWVIARIYVPDENLDQARQAAFECGRNPDEVVHAALRVADLLDDATGIPAQILRLCELELREILELASSRMRRPLKTWDDFTRLRVPIQVETISPDSPDSPNAANAANTARTAYWPDAFGALTRCLLLGEPGAGKSSLLWAEAGEACRARIDSEDVRGPFGVFLPAVSLAGLEWADTADGCIDILARHLAARRSVKATLRPATEAELARRIREGAVLLAVDALDEVDRQRLASLTGALRLLAGLPQVRLLISVRLGSYEETSGLVASAEELLIRPFEASQVRGAIRAWFADNSRRGERLLEALGTELDALLETPQLVWMLCWLARETDMGSAGSSLFHRRVDIFEAFLAECVERWRKMPPQPDTFQAGLLLPLAADVALGLLELRHGIRPGAEPRPYEDYGEEAVREAIDETLPVYRPLASRDLVRDLLSTGVLTRAHGGDIDFASTIVAEYLAGRSLARTVRMRGWNAIRDWVDTHAGSPEWHETIVFLAACMDEPAPLFELLTDPRRDDESRTRLALAAMCLPDVVRRTSAPLPASAVVAAPGARTPASGTPSPGTPSPGTPSPGTPSSGAPSSGAPSSGARAR